jgi:hypothetical protein
MKFRMNLQVVVLILCGYLFILANSCTNLSDVREVTILKDLFTSTGGNTGSWVFPERATPWNFSTNPCYTKNLATGGFGPWYGLLCSNDSIGYSPGTCYISQIILSDLGLHGKIPRTIGDFTNLKVLIMERNRLSGKVN